MNKRHQHSTRNFLSVIFGLIGIGLIIFAIFLATGFSGSRVSGAQAASIHIPRGMKMTQKAMQASILPIQPMYDKAVRMTDAQGNLACPQSANALCYTPQQLRQAYTIQPLLDQNITGKGYTITIIDAFQDPTVASDLHLFDQLFNLPDPQLNIIAPNGLTPFNAQDDAQTGFALEIGLDVEWAHVVAPDATIDLVLANVQQETLQGEASALLQATAFAVQNNMGSAISQSFGISESCAGTSFIQQEHALFQQARAQHQSVFASAGDMGSAIIQCNAAGQAVALAPGANYPASDPLITSVGGTTLQIDPQGAYAGETTWNESQNGEGATGGGQSAIFALPNYQRNSVRSTHRFVSDISLDADPLTGVAVVSSQITQGMPMIIPIGGTSVGSPVMAGLATLFDQAAGQRLGFLNSALYRLSLSNDYAQGLHDVQNGNNAFVFQNNNQTATVPGFAAGAGWDAPTGVGTPIVANLAQLLPEFIHTNDGKGL